MRRLWLIFAQATTIAMAVIIVLRTFAPEWFATANAPAARIAIAPVPASASYSGAARRAMPAVVSVTSTRLVSGRAGSELDQLFGLSPQRPRVGLGSGVIVTPDGYILTNNHVVEGAQEIEVRLADHREAAARVVGRDPDTDLAVLRIDLHDLPTLTFADDTRAHVGDVVLAIGYPFGVGKTVTQGIVSALRRNDLGINTYENFIQTDAAINPGNSGGALVDVEGNLLGINTAIFSRSGGSLGIGFAVPASIAHNVLRQLIASGHVLRGWIGVEPVAIDPTRARTLRLPAGADLEIAAVLRGGPADRAGVEPGDVVVDVAGHAVHDTGELLDTVAALQPGNTVDLRVIRRGRQEILRVKVAERPADAPRANDGGGEFGAPIGTPDPSQSPDFTVSPPDAASSASAGGA